MLTAHKIQVQHQSTTLLHSVSLTLQPGELLAVIGPNGAGKSTLLKTLSGDIQPSQGDIHLNGRPLKQWSLQQRAQQRAVLPQHARLNFPFPVLEVVLLGRSPHPHRPKQDRDIAYAALEHVEAQHLARRTYTTLSGGERQRVHLARVLAQIWQTPASYLLLDEPTAHLDLAHQHAVLSLLKHFSQHHVGILLIIHDVNLAARYADRLICLHQGHIYAQGQPNAVLTPAVLEAVFQVKAQIITAAQSLWVVVSD